jgi:hypothetical protein
VLVGTLNVVGVPVVDSLRVIVLPPKKYHKLYNGLMRAELSAHI